MTKIPNSQSGQGSTGPIFKKQGSLARSATMRQRRATAAAPSSKDNITQNLMMYYMDDTPGIKVGPMTVLVMTLVYMSIVVMLHILGKFKETITG